MLQIEASVQANAPRVQGYKQLHYISNMPSDEPQVHASHSSKVAQFAPSHNTGM